MRWVGRVSFMGDRKGVYRVMVGNLKKRDHMEDPSVDGRTTSSWIFRKCVGGRGMDWIDMAQDRGTWRALVNAVMNLRVP
jgi:hypothetical protein